MFRLKTSPAILAAILLTCLFACELTLPVPAYCLGVGEDEVRLGREAAAEIEADTELVTNVALIDRINEIGQRIAKVANSETVEATYGSSELYTFRYKFKIVDEDDINAFSLPGGFIYLNKGIVDYAESDHELAGVIAHEIAHASHHHMAHLLRQESKLDGQLALVLLAGIVAGVDANDLGNLMFGAQLVRIAKSSGYGQEAEADADATAVTYMAKAGYNPVGMLTFMERLARDHASRPSIDMGILQTHPSPKNRCRAILEQVKSLGLPINRRAVTTTRKALLEKAVVNGSEITQVKIDDKVLFQPSSLDGELTSATRAAAIATNLNQFLDSQPAIRELTVSPDGTQVLGRGQPLIVVRPEDCDLCQEPANEITAQAADTLKRVIWQDVVAGIYY